MKREILFRGKRVDNGEAEYIEREAVLAEYDRKHKGEPGGARKIIAEFPAADVVPVKHGHYVGEYDGYADGNPVFDMWSCSECGCYFEDWDEKPTYKYCPQCGAKMDEEG